MIKILRRKPKKWLTLEECENLFKAYKEVYKGEPLPPFSRRYPDKLESILGSVSASWDAKDLHPTILDAAAAYFNKFIRGQFIVNGNKRMGVLYTHYFLLSHNIDFTLTDNELFVFAGLVAEASEAGIKPTETLKWCRKVIRNFTKEKV